MNGNNGYSGNDITPEILNYSELCTGNCRIEPQLYIEHKVNRGLRDLNGKGVLTGLTEISEIVSKKTVNGEEVPCRGKLYYRGYDVEQLVAGFIKDGRFGFAAFRAAAEEGAADGLLCASFLIPNPAGLLCAGHYHESPLRQYDEFPGAQRFDALFL